jgi:hypothetical protein
MCRRKDDRMRQMHCIRDRGKEQCGHVLSRGDGSRTSSSTISDWGRTDPDGLCNDLVSLDSNGASLQIQLSHGFQSSLNDIFLLHSSHRIENVSLALRSQTKMEDGDLQAQSLLPMSSHFTQCTTSLPISFPSTSILYIRSACD